jgi:cytochrome subunit of sulfide dehydrogenase
MQRWLRAALPLLVAGCVLGPQALAADDELGAYLAKTCTACHQAGVADAAIPPITGLDEATFISLIQAYRSGARANSPMQAVATSLTDEETAALAHYLATHGVQP